MDKAKYIMRQYLWYLNFYKNTEKFEYERTIGIDGMYVDHIFETKDGIFYVGDGHDPYYESGSPESAVFATHREALERANEAAEYFKKNIGLPDQKSVEVDDYMWNDSATMGLEMATSGLGKEDTEAMTQLIKDLESKKI